MENTITIATSKRCIIVPKCTVTTANLASNKHFPFALPSIWYIKYYYTSVLLFGQQLVLSKPLFKHHWRLILANSQQNPSVSLAACQPLNYVLSYPVILLFSTHSCHCKHLRAEIQKTTASQSQRRHTHHFEVFRATWLPPEVAWQKHVSDVVARSVIELQHVKRTRLKALEVSFDLQSLQDALFDQMDVPNLVSETEGEKCCTYFLFVIEEVDSCWLRCIPKQILQIWQWIGLYRPRMFWCWQEGLSERPNGQVG